MTASSSSSPPTRMDWLTTMPPSEMTATSLVPPPMSTIMLPVGSATGRPAPMAAAIGSSMSVAQRAPAEEVASSTARFSTPLTPLGTQITTRGCAQRFCMTLRMKWRSICSVTSKSAMTPSLSGRTALIVAGVRPLKDGVIADFDVTEQMLRHFIRKVMQNRWAHPRVVICVHSGVTGVEKRAVEEATYSAGARWATLIEEPMAAAIGAGLPVAEPTGSMIVDIGGGTSEVAVISLGGIVVSQSIRVGGDELDEAVISYVKKEYKL